jgi:hypothetical protein
LLYGARSRQLGRVGLSPNASVPATMRCILELRGDGMSYDRIAKQLNADGVTGKPALSPYSASALQRWG